MQEGFVVAHWVSGRDFQLVIKSFQQLSAVINSAHYENLPTTKSYKQCTYFGKHSTRIW
jgi:hypothetical protein